MSRYPSNTNPNQRNFFEGSTMTPRPFYTGSQERNVTIRSPNAPPRHPENSADMSRYPSNSNPNQIEQMPRPSYNASQGRTVTIRSPKAPPHHAENSADMSRYPSNTIPNQIQQMPRPFSNASQGRRTVTIRSPNTPPHHPDNRSVSISRDLSHSEQGRIEQNANEGNPELARWLNLPADESVFYEWWKY